ncbi:hypothetical protein CKO25_02820 [Thiocapsa imhoffii]|uniref:Uncharacterized protein n=1 Tax=Thiocapsa imhoffii TaxID=382777 RepID=A0A9X0WF84_9GAMM|nr:hypothetical protein [Thiocapsa imhoffii]MBK1643606.1 hypothetical protein [Thiocapsa imhoffii]
MSQNQMSQTGHRTALLMSLFGAVLILGVSTTTFAATVCKGMEQALCETSEECRWQAGYTRKDGIEVSSHCRGSGRKKEAVPEATPEVSADVTSESTS